MKRWALRTLWTWSVLLSGASRFTGWIEERYEEELMSVAVIGGGR